MTGLGNPNPVAPFTPSGNPIWDEIQQAHSQLSPAAQRAVTLSGVPQRASEAEAGTAPLGNPPAEAAPARQSLSDTQPAAPLRPISGPAQLNVRGLGSPTSAPAAADPTAMAHVAERNRVTAAPLPGSDPLAHTKADTGRSGIGQIHSPFLRGLATVGDAVGSAVLPNLMRAIPGTELHHRDVVGQNENVVNEDEARATAAGARAHVAAQTENILHPHEELKDRFQTSGGGIYDLMNHKWEVEPTEKDKDALLELDPEKGKSLGLRPDSEGRFFIPPQAAGGLLKIAPKKAPSSVAGLWIDQNPNGTAEQLQKVLAKTPAAPHFSAEDAALIRAVGGDPDKPETLTMPILRKYISEKQPPERAPQSLITNPATGKFELARPGGVVPEGMRTVTGQNTENTPTALTRGAGEQGEIISRAGDELIKAVNAHRDKLGDLGGYWRQATNNTPISDKATSGLMSQIASFAALQPRLHGMRSHQAMKEFETMIGGVPKDPDALIEAVKAIQGTAGIVRDVGKGRPVGSGAGGAEQWVRDASGKLVKK